MTLTKHRGHGAKPLSRENKEILSSFVRQSPYLCLPAAFSVSADFYLRPFLFHLLLSISIRPYPCYYTAVFTSSSSSPSPLILRVVTSSATFTGLQLQGNFNSNIPRFIDNLTGYTVEMVMAIRRRN